MRWKSMMTATAALILTTSLAFAQANQTFTGTVSDAMCGKKHMTPGATAAECTRECVKSGSDFALVVHDKVYTLQGDKAAIDKFAGINATVKGKLNGNIITVASINKATP
jgi:hypothetical protein